MKMFESTEMEEYNARIEGETHPHISWTEWNIDQFRWVLCTEGGRGVVYIDEQRNATPKKHVAEKQIFCEKNKGLETIQFKELRKRLG